MWESVAHQPAPITPISTLSFMAAPRGLRSISGTGRRSGRPARWGSDVVGHQRLQPGDRLVGVPGGVRGEDQVGGVAQRRVRRQRLGFEHVERGAGNRPRRQRLGQCGGIDQGTACGVDDHRAGLHPRQPLGIDEVHGLRRGRRMQADDIGAGNKRFGRHALRAQGLGRCLIERRIGDDEAKAGRRQALQHRAADLTEAEEADGGFTVDRQRRSDADRRPFASPDAGVEAGKLAQLGEDQRRGVVGDLVEAIVRDVAHRDAAPVGCRDVDIVVADAIADDRGTRRKRLDRSTRAGRKLHHRDVGAAKRLGDVLGALALLRGKLRPRAGRGSRLRLERGECIVGHDDAHQLPSAR